VAVVCLAGLQPSSAQTVEVADIRVQLFYEDSGQLSADDLTKRKDLALWNTIIGAGDAGGPARSFLVSIVLRSTPSSFLKREAVVTVTDDKKKTKVMERHFRGLLFGKDGQLVKPILVENQTCSPTTIRAVIGARTKSVTLPFECGE
jgi:hypothetical protein